ncbi:hypothetical protein D3C86_1359180 [compost metagenome]
MVELLDRADQAQVPLLDQVQEEHAAAHVLLGDRDHQTQVGLGELALGALVAGGDLAGEFNLLGGAQEGNRADLAQVHPHGVVRRDALGDRQVEGRLVA